MLGTTNSFCFVGIRIAALFPINAWAIRGNWHHSGVPLEAYLLLVILVLYVVYLISNAISKWQNSDRSGLIRPVLPKTQHSTAIRHQGLLNVRPAFSSEEFVKCSKCGQLSHLPEFNATRHCAYCGVYTPLLRQSAAGSPASRPATEKIDTVRQYGPYVKCGNCGQFNLVAPDTKKLCDYCGISAPYLMR